MLTYIAYYDIKSTPGMIYDIKTYTLKMAPSAANNFSSPLMVKAEI